MVDPRHAAPAGRTPTGRPASGGTITDRKPSAVAWRQACSGPAPPNAMQVEPRRVEAAADGHQAGRLDHRRVGDVEDRDRGLERRHARGGSASRSIAASAAAGVQRQPAAGERRRADPAEHDVGVGDRRLGAAAAVAGGPGIGAGAPRPDAQDPAGVDPGDAPAARADLDEVHDRAQDRQPARMRDADPEPVADADLPALGLARLAALDHARPSRSCRPCRADHVAAADERRVVAARRPARRPAPIR